MYNLKIITYESTGEQDIKTYKQPIKTKVKKEEKEYDQGDELPKVAEALTVQEIINKANHSAHSSMSRTKQTVYDYARANIWEWFITWTTDQKKVDRHNYEEVTRKLSDWLDNTRKRKASDLKYIIVPELHKDGAWHFHGLMANCGKLKFVDSGRKAKGMTIYNLSDWNLGFTTATQVQDTLKASNYITKYITKDLMYLTKGQRRYWNSKNLKIGEVTKEYIDQSSMELIHEMYIPEAKRHKKIAVDKCDYHNEINIITLGQGKNNELINII